MTCRVTRVTDGKSEVGEGEISGVAGLLVDEEVDSV